MLVRPRRCFEFFGVRLGAITNSSANSSARNKEERCAMISNCQLGWLDARGNSHANDQVTNVSMHGQCLVTCCFMYIRPGVWMDFSIATKHALGAAATFLYNKQAAF